MLKIFSHPRSGTHFLEAFVAKNFYPDKNLSVKNLTWGHWANRKIKDLNPYGKLFGGHEFPTKGYRLNPKPLLYIYRDGKAVAYSVWKTPNFLNKEMSKLSFSEFLRTPIDWYGSPNKKSKPELTIIEHWKKHVDEWKALRGNIVYISYEELVDQPEKVYKQILIRCFPHLIPKLLQGNKIEVVNNPVGLLPNKAVKDSWKEVFTSEDMTYYEQICSMKINY